MKKLFYILLCLALAIFSIHYFYADESDTVPTTMVEDLQADEQRELVLAASRYACPGARDAYYCSFALGVWESLVRETSGGYKCVLAESYAHNENYTVWRFKLREGVLFHDGEKFDADAVLANIGRMYKKVSSGYVPLAIEKTFPNLVKIEKADDYNLIFYFSKPVPQLLKYMSGYGTPMFSPKCFGGDGYFTTQARGTGPYKLQREYPEQYVTAVRFDNYWGEPARIKNIKIKTIKDPIGRVLALKAHEIMAVVDLGAMEPAMAVELTKNDSFGIINNEGYTTNHYLAFNGNKRLFQNAAVRKAVSLAVNRDIIVKNIFFGYASPTENLINSSEPFYQNIALGYDQDKAKMIMQEVLGDARARVKLILRQKDCNRYPQEKMAVYLQAALKEIGIDADIQILETQYYSQVLAGNDWDMTISKCGSDESVLYSLLSAKGGMNNIYHNGFADAEIEKQLEAAKYESDLQKRNATYRKMQQYLQDYCFVVPLVRDTFVAAYNKSKIAGFNVDKYPNTTVAATYWLKNEE